MIQPADFFDALQRNGLTFFTGIPDSLLKDLCGFIADEVPVDRHVIAANEGGAVALAAGHQLATGEIPVVYLQNSGIGNAINPLLSLTAPDVYRIPILLIIGWRGSPGAPDEPQHLTQGRLTPGLLDALELPYDIIDAKTDRYSQIIAAAVQRMSADGRSHALLVRRDTFAPYATRARPGSERLARREAIDQVLSSLLPSDLVVSTTGLTSREVFAYRQQHEQSHDRDFLTVGSMGHCSQIALGLAQHQSSRQVFCFDGDGSVIMHMGGLAIIGSQRAANFRHLIINNGAHDSVGGQPTAANRVDLCAVAIGCGYRRAEMTSSADQIPAAVQRLREGAGPALLELRVASRPHTDAGRPTRAPVENKLRFMQALRRERP